MGTHVFVQSAGIDVPDDLDDDDRIADPFAVQVMDEIGIDLRTHRRRHFGQIEDANFDMIIALSDSAFGIARTLAGEQIADIEQWSVPEPKKGEGQRDITLDNYRMIRDDIIRHMENRFNLCIAGSPVKP